MVQIDHTAGDKEVGGGGNLHSRRSAVGTTPGGPQDTHSTRLTGFTQDSQDAQDSQDSHPPPNLLFELYVAL